MLNNDYKVLTHIFANILKSVITQIISDTQSGFIKGRSVHSNIRLVLDLLEYDHLIEEEGFIFFIFFKAFDTIEHKFIFSTLALFVFGENFIKVIK